MSHYHGKCRRIQQPVQTTLEGISDTLQAWQAVRPASSIFPNAQQHFAAHTPSRRRPEERSLEKRVMRS